MVPASMLRMISSCWIAAGLLLPMQSHAEPVPEYDLKAAFVYNFIMFAEWPADTNFEGHTLNVCVNASSAMRAPLAAINDKPVKGKRITLRHLTSLDNLRACHALVVDSADSERWRQIHKELAGKAILTISDDEEIGQDGCIITLGMESKRIVFDIDMHAARQARIVLSSKLLRLARTVQ